MTFLELCTARYSCRSYTDMPVEQEKIQRCIEAARLAPSSTNTQPWHFIVVTDSRKRQICAEACRSGLLGINKWVGSAPVFIAVVFEKRPLYRILGDRLRGKILHHYDQGMACEHLCLQAAEDGLGSCIIGLFNTRKIRKALRIPFSRRIGLVITLGYPKRPSPPPKKRRSLSDSISYETYGEKRQAPHAE